MTWVERIIEERQRAALAERLEFADHAKATGTRDTAHNFAKWQAERALRQHTGRMS